MIREAGLGSLRIALVLQTDLGSSSRRRSLPHIDALSDGRPVIGPSADRSHR